MLIIDLNIQNFAFFEADDEHTKPAQALITKIVDGEEPAAWSHEVMGLYASLADRRPLFFPDMSRPFKKALWDSEKFVQVTDLVALDPAEEAGIVDAPDVPFVRLAATVDSGCILATSDRPLRESVEKLGLPAKYDFRIRTPADALKDLEI